MLQALANQVCEKVESKVRTTYNEVADELVSEFGNVEGTGMLLVLLAIAMACCQQRHTVASDAAAAAKFMSLQCIFPPCPQHDTVQSWLSQV